MNLTIKNIMLGYLSHRGFTCVAEILELTNGIVQEDELGNVQLMYVLHCLCSQVSMPTSTPATRLSKRILNNYHGKHAPSAQSVAEYMKHIGKRTKTVTNIDWVLI